MAGDGDADHATAIANLGARLDALATTNERLSAELEEARTRLARQEASVSSATRPSGPLDDDLWADPKSWGDIVKSGDVASVYLLWDIMRAGFS